MKRCKCGSYAINIERLTGENCDVCHYKNQRDDLLVVLKVIADYARGNGEVCETISKRARKAIESAGEQK